MPARNQQAPALLKLRVVAAARRRGNPHQISAYALTIDREAYLLAYRIAPCAYHALYRGNSRDGGKCRYVFLIGMPACEEYQYREKRRQPRGDFAVVNEQEAPT